MSYSIKIVRRKIKENAIGQAPLEIRTTIDRRTTFKSTGIRVLASEWDETMQTVLKGHKLAASHNAALKKMHNDIERVISNQLMHGGLVSVETVRQAGPILFFDYCAAKLVNLEKNKAQGTIRNYVRHLKKFEDFAGSKLLIRNISPALLDDFQTHLYNSGLCGNSVWDTFKHIRKFYNIALAQEVVSTNPFRKMEKQPVYRASTPTYLVLDELDKLEKLLDGTRLNTTMRIVLTYFLLECYSSLRFGDWPRFTIEKMMHDDSLKVSAKKNGEPVYLPIDKSPRLRRIVDRAAALPPFTFENETTNRLLKAIGPMAGLDKELHTHVGRHSFGVMCATLGLSKETTAELMGISTKTVDTYYKVIRQKVNSEFAAWGKIG